MTDTKNKTKSKAQRIDKSLLVKAIIQEIQKNLQQLADTEKSIREETTHEESKPENEYDTRAIESGYLAKAHSKRLLELNETLAAIRFLEIKSFTDQDPIAASALVKINVAGTPGWYFYLPSGGGLVIDFAGQRIQLITPASPLGEAIQDLMVGDFAVVEKVSAKGAVSTKEYEILEIQ